MLRIERNFIKYFNNIINICDNTTTNNVLSQMSIIQRVYGAYVNRLHKKFGGTIAYLNLKQIIDISSHTSTGNISHNIATIKGICIRMIAFIQEFGLE